MPKAPAFSPKPPVEKLPLAVRKDIRDNYESKKEDYATEITSLLGLSSPFVINLNANEIWAYSTASSSSAGYLLSAYVEGFIDSLKSYIDQFGDEGKNYFNAAVTQSELTVNANELGDKAPTIDADVKDGVIRILFRHDCLGYNCSSLGNSLTQAIEDAPHEGFSLRTKNSIENDYNAEIEDLQAEIGQIIGLPDIVLDPNFDENYKALLVKEDQSWRSSFGGVCFNYFKEGLKYQLERQGFKGDEMLQEGLGEALTSKTIKIRIVPKTKTTNEVVLDQKDGVIYLQTTVDYWAYNISDMGYGLIDLL